MENFNIFQSIHVMLREAISSILLFMTVKQSGCKNNEKRLSTHNFVLFFSRREATNEIKEEAIWKWNSNSNSNVMYINDECMTEWVWVGKKERTTYVFHQSESLLYLKTCFEGPTAPFASASDEDIVIVALIYWTDLKSNKKQSQAKEVKLSSPRWRYCFYQRQEAGRARVQGFNFTFVSNTFMLYFYSHLDGNIFVYGFPR